jgi:tryptophan synthase alpha chain
LSDALAARWAAVRQEGRAALIPYITAGFPDAAATTAFLQGAGAAGADVIELGVPWSDPVADGPVIQASTHEALKQGMSLAKALDLLERAQPAAPTIVFSYLNPILSFGAARFAARARAAGAAGVLVTDLPVGTDDAVERELRSSGLPLVRLVAPTSSPERIKVIAAASEGFVYLISRTGVTGRADGQTGRRADGQTARLSVQIQQVRSATTLPIAVGFGISEPSQAAEVARVADGVVVGSALVERMKSGGAPAALAWLKELRAAMDAARRAA